MSLKLCFFPFTGKRGKKKHKTSTQKKYMEPLVGCMLLGVTADRVEAVVLHLVLPHLQPSTRIKDNKNKKQQTKNQKQSDNTDKHTNTRVKPLGCVSSVGTLLRRSTVNTMKSHTKTGNRRHRSGELSYAKTVRLRLRMPGETSPQY